MLQINNNIVDLNLSNIANCKFSFKTDGLNFNNGDRIARWNNLTNYDFAIQPSNVPTRMPVYNANSYNNKPSALFSANTSLLIPLQHLFRPSSFFIVFAQNDSNGGGPLLTSDQCVISTTSDTYNILISFPFNGTVFLSTDGVFLPKRINLFSFSWFPNGNYTAYINGNIIGTGSYSSFTYYTSSCYLGNTNGTGSTSNVLAREIFEISVFDIGLSDSYMQIFNQQLMNTYGI